MKLKKLFATTLALAMAIVTIPTTAAKADIVDSQTAFLNTEVYDITLPTTAGQKFYLDPQGLSSVATNGQSTIPTAAKGKIIGATTMTAINNSSKPVMIETKYEVKVDASVMDVATTSSAITTAETSNSTKPAICLVATASKLSSVVSAGPISSPTGSLTSEGTVAGASGSAVTAKYVLGEGSYQAVTTKAIDASNLDEVYNSSNYQYKMTASGGAINITLGGTCNSIADYSAFTGSNPAALNLDITFKFYKADGTTEYTGSSANVMTKLPNGNYVYDGIDSTNDTITSISIDGTDRTAAIGLGFVLYNTSAKRLAFRSDWPLLTNGTLSSGNHTAVIVKDGQTYTLTFTL